MKYFTVLLAVCSLALFSSSCKQKATTGNTLTIDSLCKQYYEDRAKLYPLDATAISDYRYNDSWPNDLSQQVINERKEFYTRYKKILESYSRKTLSGKDQVNYDILVWDCDISLEGLQYKDYLMPLNQYVSTHLLIPQLADGSGYQPLVTVTDYDNWLKRLEGYLVWLDTALINMRTGMKEGYVLPKILIEKMIPQFEEFDHGKPEEHFFYTPVKNMPKDFPQADKKRIAEAYKKTIAEKLMPVYNKMKIFLQTEYLPAGRSTAGISATPLGKEYYQYMVKFYTTTDMKADDIYDMGIKEVDRITNEMEAVKQQVGFKGTLKEFFAEVKKKNELMPFSKPEQVLANFDSIHHRMKPFLANLFKTIPKSKLEIKRVPAFLESTAGSAYYNIGSPDGKRPGIFYVPIPDATKYNVHTDEALFLHEAVPGHHYQGAFQNEDTTMPQIRLMLTNYLAYVEGWALYAESLGKELGLYKDPYQYFGKLVLEMHRALRLVIDVGLHTKGWTREQAIKYSLDHEPQSEKVITSEVERYMVWPGQALAYKIGQLKILELRNKAEKELGTKFNIAEFHQLILETGAVPIKIVEDKINEWIESRKK
ncbi:MAG: DUF885 domain-containing protein [Chitinophagaceae bacterium]|nr:DUF885 domain-containing protein [Chitinophagaceae bacterium]